jgi:hypothetical protein
MEASGAPAPSLAPPSAGAVGREPPSISGVCASVVDGPLCVPESRAGLGGVAASRVRPGGETTGVDVSPPLLPAS